MSEQFDEKLGSLKRRFFDRAIAASDTLDALAKELEISSECENLKEQVSQIAHRLSGAGGTFGYPGISACASELEEFTAGIPNPVELASACRELVEEIRRAK
jgi:HPt (histidine-containing phosphotransfer) domain-containing protein